MLDPRPNVSRRNAPHRIAQDAPNAGSSARGDQQPDRSGAGGGGVNRWTPANIARLAVFAEHLSQDVRPFEIGKIMGLTRGEVSACMRRIRADLGGQAV